jgi:hypothetical protein
VQAILPVAHTEIDRLPFRYAQRGHDLRPLEPLGRLSVDRFQQVPRLQSRALGGAPRKRIDDLHRVPADIEVDA